MDYFTSNGFESLNSVAWDALNKTSTLHVLLSWIYHKQGKLVHYIFADI